MLNCQVSEINDFNQFIQGINKFCSLSYKRKLKDPKIIWQKDNVKLLYYPSKNKQKKVLLIPSIINNYHILDLKKGKSLARFLSKSFCVYIIDWTDTYQEKFENYIKIACEIVKYLSLECKISVIGHCLGGIIATAISNLMQSMIQNITLLATPWDFSKLDKISKYLSYENYTLLKEQFQSQENIPSMVHWMFFTSIYNEAIYNKYIKFNLLNKKSEIDLFLAVEYWLNEYGTLNKNIVYYIIEKFFLKNELYEKQWRLDNKLIIFKDLSMPALIVTAEKDQIVTKESIKPILAHFNNQTLINIDTGHIGMIIGKKAKAELWEPLNTWLINN